jgi:23S rRNA (cytosine1962-C5)-methyltransferase
VSTVRLKITGASARPRIFRQMVGEVDRRTANGEIVRLVDRDGAPVGQGFYNAQSEISVRLLTRSLAEPVDEAFFRKRIADAVRLRRDALNLDRVTDAYRVIHAEGDGIPGLVVDRYGDLLSAEVSVLGTFLQMRCIKDALREVLGFRAIAVRDEPHLAKREGFRVPPIVPSSEWRRVIRENRTQFEVDVSGGHKTGFFLDQRDNRQAFAERCRDRRVLDLCCHAGGFGIAAAQRGARSVRAVDLDEEAVRQARANAERNRIAMTVEHGDAFDVLRELRPGGVDALVLDPPKLVRSRSERGRGLKSYLDLNRLALRALEPGALLMTCSCSGLVDEATFLETLGKASRAAGRRMRILRIAGAAADHPVDPEVPETRYLKTVLAEVAEA